MIVFIAGVLLGKYSIQQYDKKNTEESTDEVRENSTQYSYINPLLFVDDGESDQPQYASLQSKINAYIDNEKSQSNIESASVYYRDLNTGRWTGINDDDTYAPASMLKVVLMIAYLKEAETDPSLLDKKLVYSGNSNDIEYFTATSTLVQGNSYSIRDLIIAMIDQSDNNANLILLNNMDTNYLIKVYQDLDLPIPTDADTDFMSTKTYSTIFTTLYNATYLYKSVSEQALDLLAHTTFTQGLTEGVPSSITVSHKFGERNEVVGDASQYKELHDCGIVYYPHSPYFLCVMTKGNDFSKLSSVISGISSLVYQDEDTVNKQ